MSATAFAPNSGGKQPSNLWLPVIVTFIPARFYHALCRSRRIECDTVLLTLWMRSLLHGFSEKTTANSSSKALVFWWSLAAAIVSWQLFFPPIVGLADQGDFVRIIGPLGYAPVPKSPDHKYFFVTRKYIFDPSYREPRWEQFSSEFVPAVIATTANRLLFSAAEFDLTMLGFVHAVFFLWALYRLLIALRPLASHSLAWAAVVFVLTDVGYVAYLNSFYTEPASCLWLLFLCAETIYLCTGHVPTPWRIACWSCFAMLLVAAKTQNAALCVPLAGYDLLLLCRAKYPADKAVAVVGIVGILGAGFAMFESLLPAPRLVGTYNMIFSAILPETNNPAGDLQALGLDPKYRVYSGTVAWSPGTGLADNFLVTALQTKVGPFAIIQFYVNRPARMWMRIRSVLQVAFSLRPDFCGNFDQTARRPPGAKSYAFSLWSEFHQQVLSRIGVFMFIAIASTPLICLFLLIAKTNCDPQFRLLLATAIFLSICCLLAFLTAAFGDAWELVKHQFLFNLLFDVGCIWGVLALVPTNQRTLRCKPECPR